eukprot:CAMPEP_0172002362 /NCGR_PEP_ID=MMETSP1041-20130122/3371_1 /TAXON_ID=464988 /ORGANISM="Hemiselmis andersenii, Strain CCMP439" /LENGTH=36 /DNA_ID= /DNA_START= /DNA_END= /DNA_ORIENTATION=
MSSGTSGGLAGDVPDMAAGALRDLESAAWDEEASAM